MSDSVKVVAVKGFNNGSDYAKKGAVIAVTEGRARELERNGLVKREKAAPTPQNKKAPEPENKAKKAD